MLDTMYLLFMCLFIQKSHVDTLLSKILNSSVDKIVFKIVLMINVFVKFCSFY